MPVVGRIETTPAVLLCCGMVRCLVRRILTEWRRRARSRRDIGRIDYCTLRDLGLDPGQMRFEAEKPFWRA
ncbi:MAG: hypothetical protein K2X72_08445 [Reyranella sp.]|nr:hypothetical protein [Reyranella sp.]